MIGTLNAYLIKGVASKVSVLGALFTVAGIYEIHGGIRASSRNQKRDAFVKFSLGIAALAVGGTLLYHNIDKILQAAQCPINELRDILSQEGNDSMSNRYFKLLNDTQGITCKNYLPWAERGWIGGFVSNLKDSDLKNSLTWSIDIAKRPFIALKYTCEKGCTGAATIFKPFVNENVLIINSKNNPCFPWQEFNAQWHGVYLSATAIISPNMAKEKFLSHWENLANVAERSETFYLLRNFT